MKKIKETFVPSDNPKEKVEPVHSNLTIKNMFLGIITLNYMIGGFILAYIAATASIQRNLKKLIIIFFFGLYGWYLYRDDTN
jgi:hypothetical protein